MTLVAPSLCAQAQADATALLGRLTKPAGSLGALEDLAVRLAGIERRCPPTPWPAAVAVFAADHGVVASGVTPWPPEVTAQRVSNIAAGGAAHDAHARARATAHPRAASAAVTFPERTLPSTRPLVFGPSQPMTFPISFADAAPVAVIASATSASTSLSLNCAGR